MSRLPSEQVRVRLCIFYIDSARTITECYTDDPNEFLEYLKTIDEDLIEGMDADEAGETIAKEYTSW